jgi:hypothetical protein
LLSLCSLILHDVLLVLWLLCVFRGIDVLVRQNGESCDGDVDTLGFDTASAPLKNSAD